MRVPVAVLGIAGVAVVGMACGALRQNLRDQFVSYRGAWSCAEPGCSSADVVQSKRGRNQGELRINEVTLSPHAGLVFFPGTPPSAMTATVRDCKGTSKKIPKDKVQPPGRHKIGAEADSWVIWLDEPLLADLEVGSGECSVLVVTTRSTWEDGSTYRAKGGVDVGG